MVVISAYSAIQICIFEKINNQIEIFDETIEI